MVHRSEHPRLDKACAHLVSLSGLILLADSFNSPIRSLASVLCIRYGAQISETSPRIVNGRASVSTHLR